MSCKGAAMLKTQQKAGNKQDGTIQELSTEVSVLKTTTNG
jgi:hypothetical protein